MRRKPYPFRPVRVTLELEHGVSTSWVAWVITYRPMYGDREFRRTYRIRDLARAGSYLPDAIAAWRAGRRGRKVNHP
jgi:hypothetical protein